MPTTDNTYEGSVASYSLLQTCLTLTKSVTVVTSKIKCKLFSAEPAVEVGG